MRIEYDEIHKSIFDFMMWQESKNGRKDDLSNLEESHNDTLFTNWDYWLKQAETETMITMIAKNNIIEAINENIHGANLVTECVPGFLSNFKQLE